MQNVSRWWSTWRTRRLLIKATRRPNGLERLLGEITWYLFLLITVLCVGIYGYHYIEGWTLFDSLYMTVITLASVGFQEVHPLSNAGRFFTILLIIVGLGLFTVLFSTLAQKVVQQQLFSTFRERRVLDAIKKLREHAIFCGYGRLTRIAAEELKKSGVQFVIVEKDQLRAESAREAGHLVIEGDATQDEILLQAGIKHARRLVSLLPKDADNLYAILTSRELSPDLFILTRAEEEGGEKRLRRAGANRVISPYRIGGKKIAEGLLRPHVTDFLDLAVSSSHGQLQIEEIQIPSSSPMLGMSLKEANIRKHTNVIVAAIIPENGAMLFNPAGDTLIHPNSTFIALGDKAELLKLENLLLGVS